MLGNTFKRLMAKIKRLTEDLEDLAIDGVLQGHTLEGIAAQIGFTGKPKLMQYLAKFPEFGAKFQAALSAQCIDLEEQLLNVADHYEKDMARTKAECIKTILKYRDRKRYGDKTEIDVSMSVDISGAIDAAERRVGEIATTNVIAIGVKRDSEL